MWTDHVLHVPYMCRSWSLTCSRMQKGTPGGKQSHCHSHRHLLSSLGPCPSMTILSKTAYLGPNMLTLFTCLFCPELERLKLGHLCEVWAAWSGDGERFAPCFLYFLVTEAAPETQKLFVPWPSNKRFLLPSFLSSLLLFTFILHQLWVSNKHSKRLCQPSL